MIAKIDMRTVDMCKYFDEHINEIPRDDTKLYEYLFNIIYTLSNAWGYFKQYDDYENFSYYASSIVYMRCIDPRRGNYDGKGIELKKIVNILNYLKTSLPMLKCDYEYTNFIQVIDPNEFAYIDGGKIENNMKSAVQADYNENLRNSVREDISRIPEFVKDTISKSIYKNDKLMCKRLYQSCLLTFLNSVTLDNITKKKLDKRIEKNTITDEQLLDIYREQKSNCVILWHLDEKYKDYVQVLTNKAKSEFARNVTDSESKYVLSDDVLENVLMTGYSTYVDRGDIKND